MAVFYISPTGNGSGASVDDPASLAALSNAVSGLAPGSHIYLLADQGSYSLSGSPIALTAGGTVDAPISISGIASDGSPMRAELVGSRAENWTPGAAGGIEAFRLLLGANNLEFSNLTFRNIGTGAFRVGDDVSNIKIEHIDAYNVQRFFDDTASGARPTATISGLLINDVDIHGYSKDAIRLRYDTHDVVITDVTGDSEFQDGDNFAIGIHLDGTAHDVLIQRVTMLNSLDTLNTVYPNGDGFATERGNYNIQFIDTVAGGNRDAGYDIKSTSTTLVRAIAEGNAHNFRLWATDTIVYNPVSLTPGVLEGLDASLYNFGFSHGANVAIHNAHVVDTNPAGNIFHMVDGNAVATVSGADIQKHPSEILLKKDKTSSFTLTGNNPPVSAEGQSTVDNSGATTHQFLVAGQTNTVILSGSANDMLVGGNGADTLIGNDGDDLLVGGAGDDTLVGGSGGDQMIGGTGFDIASYAGSASGVVVDISHGATGGGAAGDFLYQIEGVIGSAQADVLTGSGSANLLIGGAGNDSLFGLGGNDVLDGGGGADLLDGGAGSDTASYVNSMGSVTVDLAAHAGTAGEAAGDVLIGMENLVGSASSDYLYGDGSANILTGGGGADALDGRGGVDTADYSSSNTGVNVDLASGIGHGGDAEGDVLANVENLAGSSFADVLVGNAIDNLLVGGAGADMLVGGVGNDVVNGGADGDVLVGGTGQDRADYSDSGAAVFIDLALGIGSGGDATGDTLQEIEDVAASAFDDVLIGDGNDNALAGNGGNDLLIGGAGHDVLDGGEGFDTASYVTATGPVYIDLTGNTHEDSYFAIEALIGSAYGDVLIAGQGVHRLDGGAGNDDLTGSSLLDILIGGAGADSLHGSELATVDYSMSQGAVLVNLGTGIGSGGDAEGDVLYAIHGIMGSAFADSLIGDSKDNVFFSGAGADTMDGAGGFDSVDYSNSAAAVTVNLTSGLGSGGTAQGDILSRIEEVRGSSFGDILSGDGLNNVFAGGAGADAINGAGGVDTADYSDSGAPVTIDLGLGTGQGGDAEGDILTGIENLVGSAGDDVLRGNGASNVLSGLAGDDLLDGGAGNDTLIGGLGNDSFVIDSVNDLVVEEADAGTDLVQTSLAAYMLGANVENVTYTGTGSFTGIGNELNNVFRGGSGSDTFSGLDGDDKFFSSAGADYYDGGTGFNNVTYASSTSSVSVNLITQDNHGGDAEGDILFNINAMSGSNYDDTLVGSDHVNSLYGRGGNDVLAGNAGDDYIDGGTGNDILSGGLGDDTYIANDALDQVIEDANAGVDKVSTQLASWTLGNNLENLIAVTGIPFAGTGNALDNQITGNISTDILMGLDGDDTLIGLAGADQLFGGTGNDSADYSASILGVMVDLAQHLASGGDAQGDVLDSIENLTGSAWNDRLIGDSGNNNLIGNAGEDYLDGGAGSDRMNGGAGADIFAFDNLNSSGTDSVRDFGHNDAIRLTKALALNQSGSFTYQNGVLRLDGGNVGDNATMFGVMPSTALRYLGSDGSAFYYADAIVRPASRSGMTVIEGTVLDNSYTLAATPGASRTFFYDNAGAAPIGHDSVTTLTERDVILTTRQLSIDPATGLARTGAEGVFDLGNGDNLTLSSAVGATITSLEFDGSAAQNGVTYYVYSLVGSVATVQTVFGSTNDVRRINGDMDANVLTGDAGKNIFFGDLGSDIFALDTANVSGKDTISDFHFNDTLRVGIRLNGENVNGVIAVGTGQLALDPGSAADSVRFESVTSTFALRYMGSDASGYYYGDAAVRPVATPGQTVFEGKVGDDVFINAGGAGQRVYFFDNASAAPIGHDQIINLASGDLIMTTQQIANNNGAGAVDAVGGVFDLTGGDSLLITREDEAADPVTSLIFDGAISRQGINYFLYHLSESSDDYLL